LLLEVFLRSGINQLAAAPIRPSKIPTQTTLVTVETQPMITAGKELAKIPLAAITLLEGDSRSLRYLAPRVKTNPPSMNHKVHQGATGISGTTLIAAW
jgi:hypothetical protein